MGRRFSGKKSLLVIWKSSRQFVHTMSAVDKCSLPNRDNLMQPIHMQLSQKLRTFSRFSNVFSKSRLSFEYSQKKDSAFSLFILWCYGLRKSWLDICPKSPASDYPSKRNMANESQLCLNLSGYTCTIFIDQREGNWDAKSLF